MKFSISLALLSVFALASCEMDEPPPRKTASRYPAPRTSQYPTQPQPFTEPTPPPNVPPQTEPPQETSSTTAPTSSSTTTTPKGDYQYGIPVPGKPGFVHSPYSPDKMTDVRGYAPGTEVKDPYTGKIFLVP